MISCVKSVQMDDSEDISFPLKHKYGFDHIVKLLRLKRKRGNRRYKQYLYYKNDFEIISSQ